MNEYNQKLLKLVLDYGVQMRLVGMQTSLLEAGAQVERRADAYPALRAIEAHIGEEVQCATGAARVPFMDLESGVGCGELGKKFEKACPDIEGFVSGGHMDRILAKVKTYIPAGKAQAKALGLPCACPAEYKRTGPHTGPCQPTGNAR